MHAYIYIYIYIYIHTYIYIYVCMYVYLSHIGNMVMSGLRFTLLYSDTVRIVLLSGCFNYLTSTYKANNSHRPALHTLLSLMREENVPGLVPITPRRSLVLVVMEPMLQLESEHFYLFHLYNSLHSLKRHYVVWFNSLQPGCRAIGVCA